MIGLGSELLLVRLLAFCWHTPRWLYSDARYIRTAVSGDYHYQYIRSEYSARACGWAAQPGECVVVSSPSLGRTRPGSWLFCAWRQSPLRWPLFSVQGHDLPFLLSGAGSICTVMTPDLGRQAGKCLGTGQLFPPRKYSRNVSYAKGCRTAGRSRISRGGECDEQVRQAVSQRLGEPWGMQQGQKQRSRLNGVHA